MDKRLSNLKNTLKKEVYNDHQFPEKKKKETMLLIKQRKSSKQKKKNRFIPLLKTAVPSLLSLGIFVLLISPLWLDRDKDQAAPGPTEQEETASPILNNEHINVLFTRVHEQKEKYKVNRAQVLSIHPNDGFKMINIDTRLNLTPDLSTPQNLSDLLKKDGMKLVENEIENLLDIKLDYHIEFTNNSFIELMSEINNPIAVHNSFPFESGDVKFPAGDLRLNGEEIVYFESHIPEDPYNRNTLNGAEIRQTNSFISFLKAIEGQPIKNLKIGFADKLSEKEMDIFFNDYFTTELNMDFLAFNIETSQYDGYVELSDNYHNTKTVKEFEESVETVGINHFNEELN